MQNDAGTGLFLIYFLWICSSVSMEVAGDVGATHSGRSAFVLWSLLKRD